MTTYSGSQYGSGPSSNVKPSKSGKRGCSIVLGILLLVLAVIAVFIGRGGSIFGGGDGDGGFFSSGGGHTEISGVIGSEKRAFFEDPEVSDRLARLGYTVKVSTAGSRRIATDIDLSQHDFVFPSSAPAAQKITSQDSNYSVEYPFFSPMAVATFQPIVDLLEQEGVVNKQGDAYVLDMNAYIDLAQSGKRWRDLGDAFPSPRNVQISTTDIRTSNSAAMFLSILAWQFGQREPDKANDVNWLTDQIAPFFTGQGYTESSSAGPFNDYLSQGMGSTPMVLVYEAQFLGEQMKPNSRIKDDMVLLQLDPTVLANHGLVGISPEGKELGRLLTNDGDLQRLAARHGFRPSSGDFLTEVLQENNLNPPPSYVFSVDPPNYDRLEKLIEGIGTRYGSVPPRHTDDEEDH